MAKPDNSLIHIPKAFRRALETVRIVVFIAGVFFLAIHTPLAYIYSVPLRDNSKPVKSDVIVLMSHDQIDENWLSLVGTQRTMGALRMYRLGFAPYVVSSGSSLRDHRDQAGLQAKWLELAGVPHEAVIVERRSTRTYESVVEVIKILRERKWNTVVIVASELDVPRIRAVFMKLGFTSISFEQVPEKRPPSWDTIYYAAGPDVFWHASYEYAGLLLYKIHDWI